MTILATNYPNFQSNLASIIQPIIMSHNQYINKLFQGTFIQKYYHCVNL